MKANGCDIINRIEVILTDKNLKKRALADYAGVSLQLLRDWKNRKNVPPADILFTMAEFLGVSAIYLLTGETESGIPPRPFHKKTLQNQQKNIY